MARKRITYQMSYKAKVKRAESVKMMRRLRADADRIAAHFGLTYKEIRAQRNGVNGHFGICYEDGSIHIRLRHASNGRMLKYSSLISTLCHELAHLRYFNHGEDFQQFNREILDWAREQNIYQPTTVKRQRKRVAQSDSQTALMLPPVPSRAEQLSLF